jgi:hypothetical protein
MVKKVCETSPERGYREYFWFALTLMVLAFCAAGQGILSGQSKETAALRAAPADSVAR